MVAHHCGARRRWCASVLLAFALLPACGGSAPPAPSTTTAAAPTPATPPASPYPPSPSASASPAPTVPERYQQAWKELDASLTEFERGQAERAPAGKVGAISISLIIANANRGPDLFQPGTLEAAIAYLDDMKAMGVSAVEVQISFPVMSKDFPDEQKYLAFYRAIVDRAHERGLKVLIETSCLFAGSEYTDLRVDYSKYTVQSYFAGRSEQLVTIARELRPDFLAFGEEPVNERTFAHIAFTDEQYVAFVNSAARAIRALGPATASTRLGVGTGTWEAGLFATFVQQTVGLDFHDIHIYPLTGAGGNQIEVARRMAALAKARGRDAIVGETWLYKASAAEVAANPGAATSEIFRRDVFDFWAPLELRLVGAALALGREFDMPVVSFWGGRYFFAQLGWTPDLDRLGYSQALQRLNRDTAQAILANRLDALGQSAKRLFGSVP